MSPVMRVDVWRGFSPADSARFVTDYWSKRPLLIRGLLSPKEVSALCPLARQDMLALAACGTIGGAAPLPASRVIQERGGVRPWQCRRGPFTSTDLEALSSDDTPWTLLIGQMERHVDAVQALKEHVVSQTALCGVPRWRVDDVQVSYAPPGGSVGAHVDNFDVLLLQGRGSRRWSVETAARTAAEEQLRAGLDVRVLTTFTPSEAWDLEPGDALYLPPRFAHHGVSTHPDCLTYSIGFRAPSRAELLRSFAEHAARNLPEDDRYSDADLAPVSSPGAAAAIPPDAVRRVRGMLREALGATLENDLNFEAWLGQALTAPRSGGAAVTTARSSAALLAQPRYRDAGTTAGQQVDTGPEELGVSARQAMAEWIKELRTEEAEETVEEAGEEAEAEEGNGDERFEGEGGEASPEGALEAQRLLEAELEAELCAELATGTPNDGAGLDRFTHCEDDESAEMAQLVDAIASGAPDAPRALGFAEGACVAYLKHAAPRGHVSVFVDGTCIATLSGDNPAAAHVPTLCASARLATEDFQQPLRESSQLRDLVGALLRCGALWPEL